MKIINRPDRLIVSKWPNDPIAVWGIQAYFFILPFNVPHTARQLAELIPNYYDENDPHTREVIKALYKSEKV